uniref:Transmembrane protein n=1 Tax=Arundo donax TaxID=35708 RepID=A0A0A9F6Q7_ARUDO
MRLEGTSSSFPDLLYHVADGGCSVFILYDVLVLGFVVIVGGHCLLTY